ncbi:MAG TPA: hypothetical protein VG847_00950 [Chitinophagaceae bacterium]|nr:hypothetical protein [Chitinophagaceae bacterium]
MKKIILFFVCALPLACHINDTSNSKNSYTSQNDTTSLTQEQKDSIQKHRQLMDSINMEYSIDQFSKDYKRAKDRTTIADIKDEADELDQTADDLKNIIANNRYKKRSEVLRNLLLKIQREDFPIMRKTYIKIFKEQLWDQDINVEGYGPRWDNISYVAGIFASHANIKEFYSNIETSINLLRFKRVNFKWIEDDDNYTYYKVDSKKDSEL